MPAPHRTKAQREHDLAETARLYLRGATQAEIAAKQGVVQQQISKDLKVIQRRWQQSALVDMQAAKARELARIDHLERVYWEAWEKTSGYYALAGVQWCIERRCKIFGLDAVNRVELSGSVDIGEIRQRIVDRIDRLAAATGAGTGDEEPD